MRALVVLCAVLAVAVAAPKPEPSPRQDKRSLEHSVAYSGPASISTHSRVDIHQTSPAVVSTPVHAVVSEPVVARAVVAPATTFVGPATTYTGPVTTYSGPAAVSHQAHVDVHSPPAVVRHVAAPVQPAFATRTVYPAQAYPVATGVAVKSPAVVGHVFAHAPETRTVVAPAQLYAGASAVSHQTRIDVATSPAVVSTGPVYAQGTVVAPAPVVASAPVHEVVDARSVYQAPVEHFDVHPAPAVVHHPAPTVVHHHTPGVVQHAATTFVEHPAPTFVHHHAPAVVHQEVVSPAVVDARSGVVPTVYRRHW